MKLTYDTNLKNKGKIGSCCVIVQDRNWISTNPHSHKTINPFHWVLCVGHIKENDTWKVTSKGFSILDKNAVHFSNADSMVQFMGSYVVFSKKEDAINLAKALAQSTNIVYVSDTTDSQE